MPEGRYGESEAYKYTREGNKVKGTGSREQGTHVLLDIPAT